MKDPLKIFISYSNEDEKVATALSNLLQQAFGTMVTVFLDHQCISFGSDIKVSILDALAKADILIAVLAGSQPASTISWPGFEIGRFTAFWADEHLSQGPHRGRKKEGVIGQVAVLSNSEGSLGPLRGERAVNLGISEELLAAGGDEEALAKFRKSATNPAGDVLAYVKDIEKLFRNEDDYQKIIKDRPSLAELVTVFKEDAFDVLRNKVRATSKPSRQLIIRSGGHANGSEIPPNAKVFSVGRASEVFGKMEGDPRLFRKSDEGVPGSERYETTWSEFRKSVKNHTYGAYWCGVIDQAVVSARTQGAEVDSNLVLISANGQRYRVISTTVTTYFNNDSEVSLYLIQALQRCERGEPRTTNLLNCLIILCRFRFAFLEPKSPYYWINFKPTEVNPKDLLMELDYLNSEATNADLNQPGAWEGFLSREQLSSMMSIWAEIDKDLRDACNEAIHCQEDGAIPAEAATRILTALKRVYEEVRSYNTLLGIAIARQLLENFEEDYQKQTKKQAAAAPSSNGSRKPPLSLKTPGGNGKQPSKKAGGIPSPPTPSGKRSPKSRVNAV